MASQLNQELQSQYQQNSSWFTVLPAVLAGGATRDSIEFANPGANGILLEVRLANRSSTLTLAPTLQTIDDAGNVLTLVAFTALAANGNYLYWIHPHADKTATVKNSFTDMGTTPIPRRWRLELTAASTGAFDSEVHACYIK